MLGTSISHVDRGPRVWHRAGALPVLACATLAAATLAAAIPASAQNDQGRRPPVIDIHVHTLGGFPGGTPLCPFPPQFLASDPKTQEGNSGWSKQDCALPLQPSASPDEYMRAVLMLSVQVKTNFFLRRS